MQPVKLSVPHKPLLGQQVASARLRKLPGEESCSANGVGLRFAAVATPKGFSREDIKAMETLVKQCRYGKDLEHLLKPQTGFKAVDTFNHVALYNYHHNTKRQEPEMWGICNELSYRVGSILQQQMGDRYVFEVGAGYSTRFFKNGGANHVFIMAWPKSADDEVRRQWQGISPMYFKGWRINPLPFPKEVLIIDPSFGIVGQPGKEKALKGYQLNKRLTVESMVHEDDVLRVFDNTYLPLGFVANLIPDLVGTQHGKKLLYMGFSRTSDTGAGRMDVNLGTQSPWQRRVHLAGWIKPYIVYYSTLGRFLDRLASDLTSRHRKNTSTKSEAS